jgi:hypothetical protein
MIPTPTILTVAKNKWAHLGATLLLGIVLGIHLGHRTPKVTSTEVSKANPQVTETTLASPDLSTKTVTKLITDPAQAKLASSLIKENNALKQEVQTLASTTGTLQSKGGTALGGTITQPDNPPSVEPVPNEPKIFHFSDYQLNAIYDNVGTHFDYTLDQKLSIVSTTSKDSDGKTHVNLRAFQETPSGPKEVPTVTQALIADPGQPHWFVSPRIQGGLGVTFGSPTSKGGVLGLQLLKRGTSKAAEDTTLAILTPELILSSDKVTPGILPISLNLGKIKHNPLTNIWVSPSIDLNHKVGIVFSATF